MTRRGILALKGRWKVPLSRLLELCQDARLVAHVRTFVYASGSQARHRLLVCCATRPVQTLQRILDQLLGSFQRATGLHPGGRLCDWLRRGWLLCEGLNLYM